MSTLLTVPPELLLRITEHTMFDACKSLSLVNTQLHKFLEPKVFTCLRLNNRAADEQVLRALIEKRSRHVRKLDFELHIEPDPDDDESSIGSQSPVEGEEAREVDVDSKTSIFSNECLQGQLLPEISDIKLTILPKDDFEDDNFGDGDLGSIYNHEFGETKDEIYRQEQSKAWRAAINDAYLALTKRSGLKRLGLPKVIPKGCTTFYSPEWHILLNGVHEFDIKFWGSDDGAGWHSNTMPGYGDFIEQTNGFFFQHLASAERFRVSGDAANPIGMESGYHHSPAPFRPTDMPKLKHLKIENFFIDPALANLLVARAQQVETLVLNNCSGSPAISAAFQYKWSDFFRALRESNPVLRSVVISNVRAPLTQDEEFHDRRRKGTAFQPSDEERNNVKAIRQKLRDDPNLRVWPYEYLDDKYGIVFCDEDYNAEAFERGEDQREYEALMVLVETNAQKRRDV